MFACLWWLVGTALQVAVNGFGMLVAGRFLNGVCVGITSSQVPVYLAEIAKRVCLPRSNLKLALNILTNYRNVADVSSSSSSWLLSGEF